ncbi:Uncharacterised protein [Pseudomonas aeruginosa]|nr:Uncharacterised protein [Pseudomonas aeruginosa]
MTPRKGKLPAVLACMAALAGCNINPANQGSVSSWFSMRAGDPPSFVTGVVGFENTGSNDPSTRLTLRFRDPVSKTHAAHVTTSSYSELFSLALTPRYYELYEFEVRYLSYTVTRETGAYEERCEANGEALEKTVQKRKRSVTHTAVNVESNCRSTPLTKTDYYYETYTSKPFSAPFRAESFATNYIGDFRVQCSYKEKKGKTLVDSCRLNYGAVSRDRVDAWVAQMKRGRQGQARAAAAGTPAGGRHEEGRQAHPFGISLRRSLKERRRSRARCRRIAIAARRPGSARASVAGRYPFAAPGVARWPLPARPRRRRSRPPERG